MELRYCDYSYFSSITCEVINSRVCQLTLRNDKTVLLKSMQFFFQNHSGTHRHKWNSISTSCKKDSKNIVFLYYMDCSAELKCHKNTYTVQ